MQVQGVVEVVRKAVVWQGKASVAEMAMRVGTEAGKEAVGAEACL